MKKLLTNSTSQDKDQTEFLFPFQDNNTAHVVFGQHDQNLAYLEQRLGIFITVLGTQIVLRGSFSSCEQAQKTIEALFTLVNSGKKEILPGDIDGTIREIQSSTKNKHIQENNSSSKKPSFLTLSTRKRGSIKARTETQSAYINALKNKELVFAEGPAGTGKTWLAVGFCVSLLEQGEVDRIILSRPAVEAGERLGFLPGDLREKVDPYLRPVYDALYDFMEMRHVERALQNGIIEIAPLAFMRGRTLSNAAIILDEAQNTTSMQMKMFLTRLGEGSRMIITGDPSQIDLPTGQKSGLVEASALLHSLEGVGTIRFTAEDVVRHDLVRRIVAAYDNAAHKKRSHSKDTNSRTNKQKISQPAESENL